MKRPLLLLWAVLFCLVLKAQELPDIIPSPPSIAGLMHFEEMPVNNYTGQPNITISLGSLPITKKLPYLIALRYNTQGIRIDERSGWTGTGFSMESGGVITRSIIGLPDELNDIVKGKGIYHNPYYAFNTMDSHQKQEFLWNSSYGKRDKKWDTSQDLYQYSYMGNTGRFIIVKELGALKAIIVDSEKQEKINLNYDSDTYDITSFEIIDTKGYKYIFKEKNQNSIISVKTSTSQSGNSTRVEHDYSGTNNVPNAWYLEKILQPNNEELLKFEYQTILEQYSTPKSSTAYNLVNQGDYNYGATTELKNGNNALLMPKLISTHQNISSNQKYPNLVIFKDGSKIKYNISQDHPEFESNNGAKLNSIQIFNPSGNENKRIEFDYETTSNNRLFLTRIKEVFSGENSQSMSYNVGYTNKEELPSFGDERKDAFGYYNGAELLNTLSIISRFKPEKSVVGSISSITYPTGGRKEFAFEANSYGYQGSQRIDPKTILDNRIGQNSIGNLNIDLQTQVSNNKFLLYADTSQEIIINSSILSSNSFSDPNKHLIRIREALPKTGTSIVNPEGTFNYSNYNVDDFQYKLNGSIRNFPIINHNTTSTITAGWHIVELITPSVVLTPNPTNINLSITINHSVFELNTINKKGGGIRIKDIIYRDYDGQEKSKTSYTYKDNPNIDLVGIEDHTSSGSMELNSNSRYYTKTKIHPFISNIFCYSGVGSVNRSPRIVKYDVVRDIADVYTPLVKGNYVGYKYVQVYSNGSEFFEYISPREIQIQTDLSKNYPFKTQQNTDYKRGKLKKHEVYDNTLKKLEENIYDYWDISSVAAQSFFIYETQFSSCPWNQFYTTFENYKNNFIDIPSNVCGIGSTQENSVGTCYNGMTNNPDVAYLTHNYIKGIRLPKEVTRKKFFYKNNELSQVTIQKETMSYDDKNKLNRKTIVVDENGDTVSFIENFFYSYNKPDEVYTNQEKTIFDLMVDQNIIEFPVYKELLKNNALIQKTKSTYKEYSDSNFQKETIQTSKGLGSLEPRLIYHSYDNKGNPLELSKADGTRVVYIWGYEQTQPVAKLEGITFNEIPTALYNAVVAASNADDDRTIGNLGKEGELREALQSLRDALPSAMVTSYTHDPLIGVTSITDPRGATVYYEYDDFNRLVRVKDQEGNVVTEHAYNYKNNN